MKRLITLLFVASILCFADVKFANVLGITYDTSKWNNSYCLKYRNSNELCMSYSLKYPVNIKCNNQEVSDMMTSLIESNVKSYKKSNAKEFISDNGGDDTISGNWDDEYTLELFSSTKHTFTISFSGGGYTGGAHGNYGISFSNYNIKNGKKINLSDLISNGKKSLSRAVEKYYRQKNGIKPNENLTSYDWFNDKFILAENFAITDKGIYFLYNSYEIKPYSSGQTNLLVPYKYLKNVLDFSGVLSSYTDIPNDNEEKNSVKIHTFDDNNIAMIKTYSKILGNGLVSVEVEMKNLSNHKLGWLSVSFPQLRYEDSLLKNRNVGFDNARVYPRGKRIYNITKRKTVNASYLLVEGESKHWKRGETKSINLILNVPKGLNTLYVNLRGSFKEKNKPPVSFPNDGVDGQQGFYNYRLRVDM